MRHHNHYFEYQICRAAKTNTWFISSAPEINNGISRNEKKKKKRTLSHVRVTKTQISLRIREI